jgi:hypothetical protein
MCFLGISRYGYMVLETFEGANPFLSSGYNFGKHTRDRNAAGPGVLGCFLLDRCAVGEGVIGSLETPN